VALKEFFARSLAESGVHGAAMLVPHPAPAQRSTESFAPSLTPPSATPSMLATVP